MYCLLLAGKRLVSTVSHPNGINPLISIRWISLNADPTSVSLRRLPKIELNPGEHLPMYNNNNRHTRVYQTLIVNTDGSSYYAEAPMPFPIIFLPMDLSKLSEEELEKRRMAHLPAKKVSAELDEGYTDEEIEVKKEYEHLV